MRVMMVMGVVAAVLVSGCSNESGAPEGASGAIAAVQVPDVFVSSAPDGEPEAIHKARKTAQPGDEVLIEGLVMGVMHPFVEGRGVFVLGDESVLTRCDAKDKDHCDTPWDVCCDPPEARATGTASIQVLDAEGDVLRRGLKGVGGLKELSHVTVAGTVAPQSTEAAFMINASALYVTESVVPQVDPAPACGGCGDAGCMD